MIVSLLVGIGRHAGRVARRRPCAPRGWRRWRRCARPSCPSAAPRPRDHGARRSCSPSSGSALACVGLFGNVERSGTAAGADRRRARSPCCSASSILSPRLVRPLASVVGLAARAPARADRAARARERACASPGRTAVTAAALMIGLALVAFVTVFAAGAQGLGRATRSTATSRATSSSRTPTASRPIPAAAAPAVARGAGRRTVSALRSIASAKIDGASSGSVASALDPRTANQVLNARLEEGLGGDAAVARRRRGDHRRRLGEAQRHQRRRPIAVLTPTGRARAADAWWGRQGQRRPARQPAS